MGSLAASGVTTSLHQPRLSSANPGTITASIGVLDQVFNPRAVCKLDRFHHHQDRFLARVPVHLINCLSPEERAMFQSLIDSTHE